MSTKKLTILYSRLSRDDELQGPSNSIVNQQQLLQEYAERHGLVSYILISDDGWSGTRWDRPGWQELLAKVEADEVSCICIKDGSRLGRDYLRAGLYREMFRERGVRLIAVNDGYDSELGDDDFTPFREIISEWYARDTSRKIKSSLQSKGQSGKPISTKPPYGFRKDPDDRTTWLVDEEAAVVVRKIFKLTIEGVGLFQICRILHDDKVERPSYYMTKRGYVNYRGALDTKDPYTWSTHMIIFILSRPEYAGHTVNFRSVKPSYKSKRQVKVPEKDWLIFKHTHKPIVPQETWDLVQKLRLTKRRTDTWGEANPLTGLVFCADCGKHLYNHRGKGRDFYSCSGYTNGKIAFAENHCSTHHASTASIREILLDVIRRTSSYVREYEAEFVKRVREMYLLRQGETTKGHTRQIAKNERRIAELDTLFQSLYEDKVMGVLSAERFAQMSGGYEQEQVELKAKNVQLQSELDAFNADNSKADKFISLVQKYTRFEELTPVIINEFVDRVIIHEGVWSEQSETERRKGTRSQEIEIYLKHIGKFAVPEMRSAEEIEAERIAEEKLEHTRRIKRESARRQREKKRAAEAAKSNKTAA